MLTQTFLDTISAPSFADEFNARTRARMGSGTYLAERRARLWLAQGGICPACGKGEIQGDPLETCHIIAATHHGAPQRDRAGSIPGNLFAGHLSCNRLNGERSYAMSDLARPDVVWTGAWRYLPV